MADNLMYIPNDNTHNYPFCILKLVVEETLGHSTQWANQSKFTIDPKVLKPKDKKTLLYNYGD